MLLACPTDYDSELYKAPHWSHVRIHLLKKCYKITPAPIKKKPLHPNMFFKVQWLYETQGFSGSSFFQHSCTDSWTFTDCNWDSGNEVKQSLCLSDWGTEYSPLVSVWGLLRCPYDLKSLPDNIIREKVTQNQRDTQCFSYQLRSAANWRRTSVTEVLWSVNPLWTCQALTQKMKQQLPLLTAKCTAQSAKASISQWKTVLLCSFTLFRGVTPKQTKKIIIKSNKHIYTPYYLYLILYKL